jgi:hypothetical protein
MKRHFAIGVVLLAACGICFALTNAQDVFLRIIGALAGVFGIYHCLFDGSRKSRTRSSQNYDTSGGDGSYLIDGHSGHGNHGHAHDGGGHGGDGGGHGGDGGGADGGASH